MEVLSEAKCNCPCFWLRGWYYWTCFCCEIYKQPSDEIKTKFSATAGLVQSLVYLKRWKCILIFVWLEGLLVVVVCFLKKMRYFAVRKIWKYNQNSARISSNRKLTVLWMLITCWLQWFCSRSENITAHLKKSMQLE